MLLEFIPVRLFFCHLDHRVLIKILNTEEFSLFENSVRKLDFLMLNILLGLMNAFHLQMSVDLFFLPSLVFLIFLIMKCSSKLMTCGEMGWATLQ